MKFSEDQILQLNKAKELLQQLFNALDCTDGYNSYSDYKQQMREILYSVNDALVSVDSLLIVASQNME